MENRQRRRRRIRLHRLDFRSTVDDLFQHLASTTQCFKRADAVDDEADGDAEGGSRETHRYVLRLRSCLDCLDGRLSCR